MLTAFTLRQLVLKGSQPAGNVLLKFYEVLRMAFNHAHLFEFLVQGVCHLAELVEVFHGNLWVFPDI
jgi:hypothetical protein